MAEESVIDEHMNPGVGRGGHWALVLTCHWTF